MKKSLLFIGMFIFIMLLSACGKDQAAVPAQTDSTLVVATSISPLADLIKNVGGDKVKVTMLVRPGGDPHSFELTPEAIKSVAQAKVFFANGVGEEPYLDKLVKSTGELKVVTLSDGMEILGKGSGGAYSDTGNPHLWLDPQNAGAYVKKIRDTLQQLSPSNADYFSANADAYLIQLETLDKTIRSKVSAIPSPARTMLVFHEAWPYFAKRYGLEHRALVKNSDSEPSAKEYAELISYIKAHKVKVVFGEAGFNPKLVTQLAQEAGIKYVDNLYDDTVANNPEADNYLKMMYSNADKIVNALK